MKVTLIQFIVFVVQINYCFPSNDESADKCLNRIYRECTHASTFTDEQIENVRLYLQKRFSKTRPIGKPCKTIHVRKDIKCLTEEEFQDFVDVVKQLNKNGFMDRMTEIHDKSWPSVHKFGVGRPWHRWFLNQFEKEMLKIDPKVTLPYWNYFDDFAEPHRSVIWELFGHSGTPKSDYCVIDGPFANLTFNYPTSHCLRRQWRTDGSMNPWEGPEWLTAFSQMGMDLPTVVKELQLLTNWSTIQSVPRNLKDLLVMLRTIEPSTKPWSTLAVGIAYVAHFKTHLSIGGFRGDMSVGYAPNDVLFYVFHAVASDMELLSWQLADDKNLVPHTYGMGVKYDFKLHRTAVSNIKTDVLPVYTDIKVKEAFQIGYGELCYVHDRFVEPILELMRGERRPLPQTYYRLKAALPSDIFTMFYPKFAYSPQKVTFFDYIMTDVPEECNAKCSPTPVALNYLDTPEGISVWHRLKNDLGMDLTLVVTELQNTYLKFMGYLNQFKYCSPYVL